MPAPFLKQQIQEVPLKLVGGNNFGRYPKISREETFNMIVSDEALVPYAGWFKALAIAEDVIGRALYSSQIGNLMLAVIGTVVYKINSNIQLGTPPTSGSIATSNSNVFMAENNSYQILITDGSYIYIYDYDNDIFYSSAPGASNPITWPYSGGPGYCSFQDGRFVVAVNGTQNWALSLTGSVVGHTTDYFAIATTQTGVIQSKPGYIQATVPMPGGGNNILIMGDTVCESWQNVGAALFPYQRNSSFNIDYGCLNPSSIAALENFVVWLAVNEQSGPVIMVTQGSAIRTISTDGINFRLSNLTNPTNCSAILFKQDGHMIYQFTFPDDNLSYAYDFNSSLFFTVTDEDLNYHPAKQIVFFNNDYYFVSFKDGHLYRFGTQYTDAYYDETDVSVIPRIRVTPPLRLPTQRYYINKSLGFTVENGLPNEKYNLMSQPGFTGTDITTEDSFLLLTEDDVQITTEQDLGASIMHQINSAWVGLSISRDGGESFGSTLRLDMNDTGHRKSRFIYQRLGIANDSTFQLRFSGFNRFVAFDGVIEVYQ